LRPFQEDVDPPPNLSHQVFIKFWFDFRKQKTFLRSYFCIDWERDENGTMFLSAFLANFGDTCVWSDLERA